MRALVVFCHPNPDSFGAAARDRVLAGLGRGGHEVRLTDLYAEGFRPEMSAEEARAHLEPGVTPELDGYADDLRWAELLIFVYPTWWSGQPAMLKGWMDRVWAAGVAWSLPPGRSRHEPLLTGLRQVVIVTTHGSSKWVNVLEGESGRRTMFRALRHLAKRRITTTWVPLYGLDTLDDAGRVAWLDEVEESISRL